MDTYIKKGNHAFRDVVVYEYVDKASLIPPVYTTLHSESRYSGVKRCRSYWGQPRVHTMPSLPFIKMDFDGLTADLHVVMKSDSATFRTRR